MLLTAAASRCHTKSLTRCITLTNRLCSVCREDSHRRYRYARHIFLVWSNYGELAKPGSDFMGQGGKEYYSFTFLEFHELNELATRQHTQSAHRRLLKMKCWYCLVVSVQTTCAGYSPSEASRRWGDARDYIADFQAGFSKWSGTGWSVRYYHTNAAIISRRAWRCCKTLIAELVAITMSPTHRPVDSKTGKYRLPRLLVVRSHNRTRY